MKKGLILTGLMFIMALILIASANYVVIGDLAQEEAIKQKMEIDTVINRQQETHVIIEKAIEDGINQGEDCNDAASKIESYINSALNNNLMEQGPITFGHTLTVNNNCPSTITIEVEYTINTDTVERKTQFTKTIDY